MKFIVIKSNLRDGIVAAQGAVGENLNLPILKNGLFEAENNKIKITATNLEIAITANILGKIIDGGKFTAPLGLLSNLISNIQSDRLNIEEKKGKVEVKTDNYEATIQGMAAGDFPITPKIKDHAAAIEIKAGMLKEALGQVLTAAQFSDLRPELNSVLFGFAVNNLKLVATDSFRLAEKTINSSNFTTSHKEVFEIMVPLKTAEILSRILKDEDTVKIHHDQTQVLFKTEQIELLSRLIEGKFPDYAAILPKKFDAEILFNRLEFMSALKLTGIFGSKSGEVKLRAQENKKAVEIISADQAIGENNYVLPAKIQGKIKETTFNWRYIMDALKVIKSEEVFLGLNSDAEPAAIKSPGDASYLYILKPIAES